MNLYLTRMSCVNGNGASVPVLIPADDHKIASFHVKTMSDLTGLSPVADLQLVGRTDELVGGGAEPHRESAPRQESEREERQLASIEKSARCSEIIDEIGRCHAQIEFGAMFVVVLTQAEWDLLGDVMEGRRCAAVPHALCVMPTELTARRAAIRLADDLFSVCCPSMKST